jgi:origin recognition complex subunit 6
MATTPIETSLSSLLPTLNGNLPSELVHLATSLLAQSRTRINLKPTEEIARPYACAEVACKRLQSKLKLPGTHRRPPLPPRVYAKLLEMMENGLQLQKSAKTRAVGGKEIARSGSSPVKGTSTPRKRDAIERKVGSAGAEPTPVTTRSKKVAFAGKVSAQKVRGPGKDDEAPDWVMPLIRRLCTRFTTPLLPPHVYTGTCVVLKLAKLWPVVGSEHEDDLRTSITAMTIAIYFMVLTKMQRGKMTPELYVDRCGKALDVAVEMGSVSFSKDVVDGWIKKMNDKGWCRQQDWWDSVPEDVMDVEAQNNGREDVAEEDDVIDSKRKRRRLLVEGDQTEGDKEGVLLPGLGTMMQDAVDFLSEERTLNYLEWKEGVLGRIKQMEKGKGRMVSVR